MWHAFLRFIILFVDIQSFHNNCCTFFFLYFMCVWVYVAISPLTYWIPRYLDFEYSIWNLFWTLDKCLKCYSFMYFVLLVNKFHYFACSGTSGQNLSLNNWFISLFLLILLVWKIYKEKSPGRFYHNNHISKTNTFHVRSMWI